MDEHGDLLRQLFRSKGRRLTSQRRLILNVLEDSQTHLDAEALHDQVKALASDISLATVYKALEAFVEAGLARKLAVGGGPARYDGRTDDHDHVRCLKCGIVRDVIGPHDSEMIRGLRSEDGFEIVDYRLELLGYCPACRS